MILFAAWELGMPHVAVYLILLDYPPLLSGGHQGNVTWAGPNVQGAHMSLFKVESRGPRTPGVGESARDIQRPV